MKILKCSFRTWLMRVTLVVLAGTLLTYCIKTVREKIKEGSLAPVSLSAAHHLGGKFNIPTFYVNRSIGGNVGWEGGSGTTCCVLLPKIWRPGLSVEVRWEIGDWSHENIKETDAGNYRSVVSGGAFIAQVPVERYEKAEQLWVHFFAGGRARVISSSIGSEGPQHPIQDSDPHAGDSATAGKPVKEMFSPAELLELERIDQERKKKFGDWR